MVGRTSVIALVASGCIAAAGIGGYLAVRAGSGAATASETPMPMTGTGPSQPGERLEVEPSQPNAVEQTSRAAEAPAAGSPSGETTRQAARSSRSAGTNRSRAVRSEDAPAAGPAAGLPALPVATDVAAPPTSVPVVELPAPEPAQRFVELTVPADSVVGIRVDTALSSETSSIEDRVTALVSRDVTIGTRTVIPAGARVEGYVTTVERGSAFKDRARLGIQFDTIILPDGARLSIETEPIYRSGESPTGEATSKIGASAVVGAILGAVIGGGKGAAIGGAAGAAGGSAVVMAGGANHAVIAAGTPLTVQLTSDVTVLVDEKP
jgi:hypothetical protein